MRTILTHDPNDKANYSRFCGASGLCDEDAAWNIDISYCLNGRALRIRNLRRGDESSLRTFGDHLSTESRVRFSPYPWDDEQRASRAFTEGIRRNADRTDAAYIAYLDTDVAAHLVLWGIGLAQHLQSAEVRVATLGIAVVDTLHNNGIGTFCLHLAIKLCQAHGLDAIELTTAKKNAKAIRLYHNFGFIDCGLLEIPLDVDPSTAIEACQNVSRWRIERHMYYPVNRGKRDHVLAHLRHKQRTHCEVRGRPCQM